MARAVEMALESLSALRPEICDALNEVALRARNEDAGPN